MPDLFNNRLGLTGFEFIEFTVPALNALEPLFERMGFRPVAKHRNKDVVLYRGGGMNFVVNREPANIANYFAAEHGPSACGLAFRVADANKAYALALKRGAHPMDIPAGLADLPLRAIEGVGGAPLYLVDHVHDTGTLFDAAFESLPDADHQSKEPDCRRADASCDIQRQGRMAFWGPFYERLFGFHEIRFVDIDGKLTVLTERTAPGRADSPRGASSQEQPQGSDHLAEELAMSGILLDGSTEVDLSRLLLQIFNGPMRGPAFFEFIKRTNNVGPGQGHFKAIFASVDHGRPNARQARRLASSSASTSEDIPSI